MKIMGWEESDLIRQNLLIQIDGINIWFDHSGIFFCPTVLTLKQAEYMVKQASAWASAKKLYEQTRNLQVHEAERLFHDQAVGETTDE